MKRGIDGNTGLGEVGRGGGVAEAAAVECCEERARDAAGEACVLLACGASAGQSLICSSSEGMSPSIFSSTAAICFSIASITLSICQSLVALLPPPPCGSPVPYIPPPLVYKEQYGLP